MNTKLELETLFEVKFSVTGYGHRQGFLMPLIISEDGNKVLGITDGNSIGEDKYHEGVVLGVFQRREDGVFETIPTHIYREVEYGMETQFHNTGRNYSVRHTIGAVDGEDWQLVVNTRNDYKDGFPDLHFETSTGKNNGLLQTANQYLGRFRGEVIRHIQSQ